MQLIKRSDLAVEIIQVTRRGGGVMKLSINVAKGKTIQKIIGDIEKEQ